MSDRFPNPFQMICYLDHFQCSIVSRNFEVIEELVSALSSSVDKNLKTVTIQQQLEGKDVQAAKELLEQALIEHVKSNKSKIAMKSKTQSQTMAPLPASERIARSLLSFYFNLNPGGYTQYKVHGGTLNIDQNILETVEWINKV
jgi:hypothetical protein